MNIIIKKVRVVAAPVPPFVGTRLTVVASEGQMTFKIVSARKIAERPAITVDWNDGCVERINGDINRLEHTYAQEGVYEIEIGDDITSFQFSGTSEAGEYKNMLVRLFSNAPSLVNLSVGCFANLANLVEVDLAGAGIAKFVSNTFNGCSSLVKVTGVPHDLTTLGGGIFKDCHALTTLAPLPAGVTSFANQTFANCIGLRGRLDFPHIRTLNYTTAANATFVGCDNIFEIHFSATHKESIMASHGYQMAQTLGAANASVSFDL